jgi:hypothetical protein
VKGSDNRFELVGVLPTALVNEIPQGEVQRPDNRQVAALSDEIRCVDRSKLGKRHRVPQKISGGVEKGNAIRQCNGKQ